MMSGLLGSLLGVFNFFSSLFKIWNRENFLFFPWRKKIRGITAMSKSASNKRNLDMFIFEATTMTEK